MRHPLDFPDLSASSLPSAVPASHRLESAPPARELLRLAVRWMLRLMPAVAIAATVHAGPAKMSKGGDTAPAEKGEVRADKGQFHLFNPVPRPAMREMSTDRPDQTESPYTVDAGHFQLEMDFANGAFDTDRSNGGKVRTRSITYGGINLKAGLLNHVDIQFVLDSYVDTRANDRAARTVSKASGIGDLQTRLKVNLWGDDGGRTALAIMPFVKWPLPKSDLRNGKTEGGVIIPLSIALPAGWSTTVMTEVDFARNEDGGYNAEFIHSITASHDIAGQLGGYVEFFSVTGNAPGFDWIGQVDVGLTCAITDNLVFDAGCNFGVTESAPDFNPFAGFSVRY